MLIGQQLGPFAVDRELGSGAMGTVYRARYAKTGQFVAIKIMSPALGSGERGLARFEREAAILKQLKHPNIVRIMATGTYHGQPFYAMEYIDGESLDHVMARRGRISWEEVVAIGQQLCAGLQHAHEKGIIHRDLKPSNLMVLRDGTVKLTDFGIAKDLDVTALTSAHCTVGTAAYMSPEQCRGERDMTNKSDLYSLGMMLFELLTGRKPFLAETPMDMFLQHVNGTFERPSRLVLDIPIWLDTLVCQLLEKKPEHRPLDATMVGQVLGQIQEKVTAQKSAGVDAVEMRRVDRPRTQAAVDETDREAAKLLRTGLGKFKVRNKRRKQKPFLQRKWVQAVGIVGLLAVAITALVLMLQPPSAEKLYTRTELLMTSGTPDERARGRELIRTYMKHYGKHDNDRTRQMRAWADAYDVEERETQMYNRRRVQMRVEGEAEERARRALNAEEGGDLADARKQWQAMQKFREDGDADQRVWGLLADKRLHDLDDVAKREEQLTRQVREVVDAGKSWQSENEAEDLAGRALEAELAGKPKVASSLWTQLRDKVDKEPDQRFWLILAAKKKRDLDASKPAP